MNRPADPEETFLVNRLISGMDRPDTPIDRVSVGQRFVGVFAGGRLGVASTLGAAMDSHCPDVVEKLIGRPLSDASNLMVSAKSGVEISIGLAALNAGMNIPPVDASLNAGALLKDLAQGRKAVIVGDFPFAVEIQTVASSLDLLELRPVSDSTPWDQWDKVLGDCEVAAITSTALISRSLAYFLKATPKAVRILIGPSTPVTPLMFDQGADILSGCRFTNPEAVMAAIERDATFREIKRAGVDLICCLRKPLDELINRN